jgi:phosphoglycolate phosphatase-like HAD superfamily hydrolase
MVAKVKPDPEMVRLALGSNQAGDAVMVGDSVHDIVAAHAAGVSAYLYFPEENEQYYSYEYVKSFGADRIIRDFRELLEG